MLKGKIWLALLLALGMIVAVAVGCAEKVVDDDADPKIVIGWAVPYLDKDDSFGFYERAVRDHLDDLGVNYELIARAPDSHADHAGQLAIVEDMIALGVDIMVIAPTCFEGQQPAYRKVINADIPLIVMGYLGWGDGFDVPEGEVYFVGYSHVDAGLVNAAWMRDNFEVGTKVVIIHGTPGFVTDSRTQVDLLKEYGFVILSEQNCDYDRAKAYTATEDALAAHPDVQVFVPANSAMANGVAEAVADSGRDDVVVMGCGGTVEELVNVATGKMIASWVRSHFDEGIAAAEIIYAYVEGRQDQLEEINAVTLYMVESLDEIKNKHDSRYHVYIQPKVPGW